MPAPDASFGWQAAAVAYLIVVAAAFLVTWVVTDVMGVRRTSYVGILTGVVIILGGGYLAWSGTSGSDLVTANLGWALLSGMVVAGAVTPLIRRLPGSGPPVGRDRVGLIAWEDVVYGSDEALLLAVYPVLTIWHATTAAGWTGTGPGKVAAGVVAICGSLLVILVHHLGYAEFRGLPARRMLFGALVTCGLQAVAFVVTGNLIAPVVAHITLHLELTMRGNELPPVRDRVATG